MTIKARVERLEQAASQAGTMYAVGVNGTYLVDGQRCDAAELEELRARRNPERVLIIELGRSTWTPN